MQDQLQAEVDAAFEDSAVLRAFRRFRQRQMLRIGTNDIIRDRPLEEITRDISRVADAALEVALATALRHVGNRFGQPYTDGGRAARCVILAFGKHGGEELNYSSDIDLMFLYDEEGATRGKRITSIGNDEFFGRVAERGGAPACRHTPTAARPIASTCVCGPKGSAARLARSLASTLSYYDTLGRTWERQALIKLRPVAGDLQLGRTFLHSHRAVRLPQVPELSPRSTRSRPSSAASSKRPDRPATSDTEVKTGHGGIRDIEFTIQFLQLLNGGDLPEVRQRNTLLAMQALEQVGCLTDQEYRVLDDAYRFLRKTEHRLQLLFDLQTHRLPDAAKTSCASWPCAWATPERAARIGPRLTAGARRPAEAAILVLDPLAAFLRDYREKTEPESQDPRSPAAPDLRREKTAGRAGVRPDPRSESRSGNDPVPSWAAIRSATCRAPTRT